ncbi:hypothetical protein LQ318_04275 [Aliifodinibius salicampi]|uniref:Carboxypeptidase regulatory-like domain-containing protein n=1 Tax=Fodinibius salicampi TaxID=1920655 RepID=A0ABT3PW89_9BACT|nr:hypothetical protein [Fodinibius salicampi]MCW9712115.1 hypothetical protein [Fodinibius salicampi]
MRYRQIQNTIIVLTISLLGFACSDLSTSSDSDEATVNGRVESNEGQKAKSSGYQSTAVEGATVTMARVTADGSLEAIQNASAETNAEGEFTLQVDADAVTDASGDIIVVAEKEGQQWKACLYGELKNGSSIDLKPITIESSGEASVYQQVVARGETGLVSKADIETYIGSEAAAEIQANSEAAAEFAVALAKEAEARATFFANQSIEITEEQMMEIKNAKAEALANLHASLYASSSQSAKADAYNTYTQAVASAHTEAGINANAYAKAKEGASNLIIKNTTELSSSAQSEVRANSAVIVAIAVDKAVQARMEAAEIAESSVEAAAQAGTQLRADVRSKATAGASEIQSLFASYNHKIVDVLEQEFSANAETIVGINSQINSTGGIKATLVASIGASANTDAIVDAYSTFYSAVETLVSNLFTAGTDAEAQLVSDIMILINIEN